VTHLRFYWYIYAIAKPQINRTGKHCAAMIANNIEECCIRMLKLNKPQ